MSSADLGGGHARRFRDGLDHDALQGTLPQVAGQQPEQELPLVLRRPLDEPGQEVPPAGLRTWPGQLADPLERRIGLGQRQRRPRGRPGTRLRLRHRLNQFSLGRRPGRPGTRFCPRRGRPGTGRRPGRPGTRFCPRRGRPGTRRRPGWPGTRFCRRRLDLFSVSRPPGPPVAVRGSLRRSGALGRLGQSDQGGVANADLPLGQVPGQERCRDLDLADRHPGEQPGDRLDLGQPGRGAGDDPRRGGDFGKQHGHDSARPRRQPRQAAVTPRKARPARRSAQPAGRRPGYLRTGV